MGEVYTYDATHLAIVRDGSVTFSQAADHGRVGTGKLALDDTAGTQSIVGQKDFAHTESSCSRPLTFRGYVDDREYGRNAGQDRAPHVGMARGIAVSLVDTNAMLGFDAFTGTSGKRPAETVAARGAWLMATTQMAGIADNGRCDFPSDKGMDAANYQGQYPGDVLVDMALACGGWNHHVNDYGAGPELAFRNENTQTTDNSTLRISNVLSDASGVTLHPFKDATLTRRPGAVYSLLLLSYAKGTEFAERAATALTFNGRRTGTVNNSNIKTAAKAQDELQNLLWQHHTEEDSITCTVLATSAEVNLMPPGFRIQAKFEHFTTEGYGSFTWFQIIDITKKPVVADGGLYEVALTLSPQEAGPPAAAILQSVFARSSTPTLPNPVTIGSTLVAIISARSQDDPGPPNTVFGQPRFGAGAWTRFNGTQITKSYGTTGMTAYWKTADSIEQSGLVSAPEVVVGIIEIAAGDPASATIQYVTEGSGGPNFDVGADIAVSAGDVLLGAWQVNLPAEWPWDYVNSYPWQSPDPPANFSAGWTPGISKWSYDHSTGIAYLPAEPWTMMAYTEDAGTYATRVSPGDSGHTYAGLMLLIPPA